MTQQDVAFSSDSERQSQLRIYSVGATNASSYEVGVWKAEAWPALTVTADIDIWPGGTTDRPVGVIRCTAGKYFSTEGSMIEIGRKVNVQLLNTSSF